MTNYKSLAEKIRKCNTAKELLVMEKKLDKLFNSGNFSTTQFSRLDNLIVEQHIKYNLSRYIEY